MRFQANRLLVLGASLLFAACATVAPPLPPSLDLPKPPADLRASRKGERVTLTWTVPAGTTDQQSIQTGGVTRICRSLTSPMMQCGTPIGTIGTSKSSRLKSGKQTLYVDAFPVSLASDSPSASLMYAVEVLNREGKSAGLSNQVEVSLARTLPPPRDFQAKVVPQGVTLTWANDMPPQTSPAIHYAIRAYRNQIGTPQWNLIGETVMGAENSLTDSNIEWEKTYEYRAETVTVIVTPNKPELQIEGDDTPNIKVFADDIFPPAVPSGLQAVFSGPGQFPFVDLIWAPDIDADLAGYNVYRREEGSAPTKLNRDLVKSPAYRDSTVVAGKTYVYSVSAVDARGNESTRSQEATEAVPR